MVLSTKSALTYLSLHGTEQKCTAKGSTARAGLQASRMVTSRVADVIPMVSAAKPTIQFSFGFFIRWHESQANSSI